jgi:hypothetical protein
LIRRIDTLQKKGVNNLELLAIVDCIWNDMIEDIAFNQESHNTANFVRNIVLLGQSGAQFEPEDFSYHNVIMQKLLT